MKRLNINPIKWGRTKVSFPWQMKFIKRNDHLYENRVDLSIHLGRLLWLLKRKLTDRDLDHIS